MHPTSNLFVLVGAALVALSATNLKLAECVPARVRLMYEALDKYLTDNVASSGPAANLAAASQWLAQPSAQQPAGAKLRHAVRSVQILAEDTSCSDEALLVLDQIQILYGFYDRRQFNFASLNGISGTKRNRLADVTRPYRLELAKRCQQTYGLKLNETLERWAERQHDIANQQQHGHQHSEHIESLLSDQFLEQVRQANPGLLEDNLKRPERKAFNRDSVVAPLIELLESQGAKDQQYQEYERQVEASQSIKSQNEATRDKLVYLYKKYLRLPCRSFNEFFNGYFDNVNVIAQALRDPDGAHFVKQQHQEFKSVLYRFKYCQMVIKGSLKFFEPQQPKSKKFR